jgi:hypothetical protein
MNPCSFSGAPVYTKDTTLNLAQAAASYDALTASGDVLITGVTFYVAVAGGGDLTSVAVQTNQTTALVLMTAAEGAVANLLAQSHPAVATDKTYKPWTLQTGQKIQYTLVVAGAGPTGSMKIVVQYQPISSGAALV